jgi:uncharacterized protein (DUF58 family)
VLIALALLLGLALRDPLLALVALLLALLLGVAALWDRYALAGITYERRLGTHRLFVGEETDLTVEVTNAKPLPLAWLKVEDELPAEITFLSGRVRRSHKPSRRLLTNTVSLRFYERVRKQYRVRADRRGAFVLGSVELQSGDLFGLRRHTRVLEVGGELVIYPRVLPLAALDLVTAHPYGEQDTLRRIIDDPLRLGGTRAYIPGDNPRFLHWKATARRGTLQTKIFDPSATLRTAIFLDIQTVRGSPAIIDDYLEYAVVVGASLARHLLDRGEAVGLYANAPRRRSTQPVRLAPSRHPQQWFAILDALARVLDLPALPLDRFLRGEQPGLPFGAPIVAITATPGPDTYAVLLDLQRAGHPTALLAIGDAPPAGVPNALRSAWLGGSEAYAQVLSLAAAGPGPHVTNSPVPGVAMPEAPKTGSPMTVEWESHITPAGVRETALPAAPVRRA